MENKDMEIRDAVGNYDLNQGYKKITGGNTGEMFRRILAQLDRIQHGAYNRSSRKSYRVRSHLAPFDRAEYEKCKAKTPFREEEWICKQCMGRVFADVGKIVDYQVPLKYNRTSQCEGMGKIDLLAQRGDEGLLLEVKAPGCTEEPLRAIMEIHTYWQQLGGNDCRHFLNNSMLSGATTLKKAIVLFRGSPIQEKLAASPYDLAGLMKTLDVGYFLAEPIREDSHFIGEIVECRL